MPVGAVAELALGERELPAIVDALGLGRGCLDGADPVAHAGERGDDVGEVVLALGVVGGEVAQRGPEQVAAERVDASCRPRAMSSSSGEASRCSTMRSDLAVAAADDPAVAGRVVHARW